MSCSCKIGGGPDGVCYECRSRELFHTRLRKLEDKAASDRAQGVAEERARVVAWLVRHADRTGDDKMGPVKIVLLNLAVVIERGEHEEGT